MASPSGGTPSASAGDSGQPLAMGGVGAFAGLGGSPGVPSGSGGMGGAPKPERLPSKNYQSTGSWPEQPIELETQPGKLTYTKVKLHDRFLAESCSIADYNNDGHPDVSSGRRWYEGPFGPDVPVVEHVFRGGHDDLPRAALPPEIVTGVSDSWACYPFDMDGDGWVDIVNIASPDVDDTLTPSRSPEPQAHATAYWYKNPGIARHRAVAALLDPRRRARRAARPGRRRR